MGAARRECGKCDRFREFRGEFIGYWRRSGGFMKRVDAVSMVVVWCEAYRWLNFVVGGVKSIRGFLRQFAKYPLPINV